MLFKMIPVGPLQANCYVFGSETTGKGIVVDPGGGAVTILKAAQDLNLKIELIVATHAHFDHVMGLPQVKAETGAKFAIHPLEVPALSKKPSYLGDMLGSMDALPDPGLLLEDGDKVGVDGLELTVIHTPGHSPGGICLLGEGFVLTGDTLFALGVGRADLGGDWEQLVESIKTRLFVLPDKTVVFPGHGSHSRIGVEKVQNPFVGSEAELD